jgi:hypothetical protein
MASGEITIRDATLPGGPWRNFAGRAGRFNKEGDRSFTIFLDPDVAADLKRDGWNVKFREAREEGDEGQYYLSVAVGFAVRPPTVVLITSRGRRNMLEDEVEFLDWLEFDKVDLIIRPYVWTVRGETGIKAYLKSAYFTLHEDELALEYAELPEDRGPLGIGVGKDEYRDYIEGEIVEEEGPLAIESGRRR